ncbi:MAG: hypothetical protein OEM63_04770 [Gammaproteobacteria bacterium]|nr:hypothetical protein [Gammaproteobacteria bacterium]
MKRQLIQSLAKTSLLAVFLSVGTAWAQEEDPETTIRLMGVAEATLPDVVMNEIKLPDAAKPNEAAVEKLKAALAHAGPGNLPEQSGAEDALANAKARVQETLDNREERGRGDDMPGPPDDPPGVPDDLPGPPETPPGGPGN